MPKIPIIHNINNHNYYTIIIYVFSEVMIGCHWFYQKSNPSPEPHPPRPHTLKP